MRSFLIALKVLAPIAILVGLLHVVLGLGAETLLGAKVLPDATLDSQDRFYGVVFMGNGVLLFLCGTDLRKYSSVFRVVVGFIFLGGVARLLSVAQHGWPAPPVIALIAVELLGMPLVLWWHARVLRLSSS